MSKRRAGQSKATVADFSSAMEILAPTALAQAWDNVGLLVGDPSMKLRRALFAIDLTPPVAAEAIRTKADILFCYHPPIFQPFKTLTAAGETMESLVYTCARNGVALYSSHTALDAADGGTNDVIAELCGIKQTAPLEFVDQPGEEQCKLVVFVPCKHADKVAESAFAVGAGVIGNYTHCSYRADGSGTFFGADSTNPVVGRRGQLERVAETRIELVAPRSKLNSIVEAVRRAQPYEQPVVDIYSLVPTPTRSIGRVGDLPTGTTLVSLARKLTRATKAASLSVCGSGSQKLRRAIIVVGAAGSLPFKAGIGRGDVVVTGEIRHHDALAIERAGATAIAMGHWTSERPVLATLIARLTSHLPGVALKLSRADKEPFSRPR